jgi:putative lipase involved disintegration of autophagic bodies
MGTCTGVTSSCAFGGYALESRFVTFILPNMYSYIFNLNRCHLGRSIRYDTVSKLNWSVDIRTHPIKVVIERILNEDWDPENGLEVPIAEEQSDCVVCFEFVHKCGLKEF